MDHGTDLDVVRQHLLMEEDGRRSLPQLLKRHEAAALLRVSIRTLDRILAAGELRRSHIGRVVRIELSELRAYLARTRSQRGGTRRR